MSNQDIDDPFAQFDDLDNFDTDFDQVSGSGDFGGDAMGGDADNFGEMSMSAGAGADDDMGMVEEESYSQTPNQPQASQSAAQPATVEAGSKPFLKTPLGMATVGLAVVGMVGGAATVLLGGGNGAEMIPETTAVVPPASEPNFAEPIPSQVPAQVIAQQPVQQPVAVQPVVEPIELAQPSSVAKWPADTNTDRAFGVTPDTKASELTDFIAEQRNEMKELKVALTSLKGEISGMKNQIDLSTKSGTEIKAALQDLTKKFNEKSIAVAEIVDQKPATEVKPDAKPTAQATATAVTQDNVLAKGRQRVQDFQVIDATSNGQMVIIKKASTGRVFTVFKGEILLIGGKRIEVSSIEGNGSVVMIGKDLYIDKVLAQTPARVAQKAVAKPATRPAAKFTGVREAKGFTLNAVYDSDSSFGVVDNKGNFKSYRVGESVPELGGEKVKGLDSNGNLKVGDYVIKSIY
jgi:hypothetical protein